MRDAWSDLETHLRGFEAALDAKPSVILVVSGHWDEAVPTVNSAAAPDLLFDYSGFPPHTYELQWNAPGAPALAATVRRLLQDQGISSGETSRRGWDHGVLVPLKVAFPSAEIPTLQLSLQSDLDSAAHLAIGRALTPLRRENVLILGSGQTYHNMRGFRGAADGADAGAEAFDAWLRMAMTNGDTRDDALIGWATTPGARDAQPHEDYLLPLMVAAGAASGESGRVVFQGRGFGKPLSGFGIG